MIFIRCRQTTVYRHPSQAATRLIIQSQNGLAPVFAHVLVTDTPKGGFKSRHSPQVSKPALHGCGIGLRELLGQFASDSAHGVAVTNRHLLVELGANQLLHSTARLVSAVYAPEYRLAAVDHLIDAGDDGELI